MPMLSFSPAIAGELESGWVHGAPAVNKASGAFLGVLALGKAISLWLVVRQASRFSLDALVVGQAWGTSQSILALGERAKSLPAVERVSKSASGALVCSSHASVSGPTFSPLSLGPGTISRTPLFGVALANLVVAWPPGLQ